MKRFRTLFSALFLSLVLVSCDDAPASEKPTEPIQMKVETHEHEVELSLPTEEEVVEEDVLIDVEQVVIFHSSDHNVLQTELNDWLSHNHGKVEIVRVLQSQSASYFVLITIFYKKLG